jgi:hypothetical protein
MKMTQGARSFAASVEWTTWYSENFWLIETETH